MIDWLEPHRIVLWVHRSGKGDPAAYKIVALHACSTFDVHVNLRV